MKEKKMIFRGKAIKRGSITLRELYLYELGEKECYQLAQKETAEKVEKLKKRKKSLNDLVKNRFDRYDKLFYTQEDIDKIFKEKT
jgi:hypothetical protein